MAILFAATYPDRVRALVLYGTYAKRANPDDDYPWCVTWAEREGYAAEIERDWGVARRELARFGCEEIDTAGDGFLALGEGPTSTIRCALSIRDAVVALGLSVRAGVHTGEVERPRGGSPRGIAVHVGARVAAAAGANEVFVSSTTADLVAGSGIELAERGEFELKGVGRRRLYAVTA